MIVRKIKPDEVKRTAEIFCIAFDFPFTEESSPMELYRKYTQTPSTMEEKYCMEHYASFEDDNLTMTSCFHTVPYSVIFDGHEESMHGIGGVATLPQYRRNGGIRKCFELALPSLYEQGVVFSYLYPFSTAFYRKFGYELCCKKYLYRIALAHLPAFDLTGSCYFADAGTATKASEDIRKIYETYRTSYNMMAAATPFEYTPESYQNPYKNQDLTYIYCSAAGEPLGFMTYRSRKDVSDPYLECSRFFYVNDEGLMGLLSLARTFASDFKYLCLTLPEASVLDPVLPEWSMHAVSCEVNSNGMIRVINVKKALQDAAYIGSGRISICVRDSFIPENDHTFHVEFTDNICRNITVDDKPGDLELPVSVFSAFLTGAYDANSLKRFPNVIFSKDSAPVAQVFYKKPVAITTFF